MTAETKPIELPGETVTGHRNLTVKDGQPYWGRSGSDLTAVDAVRKFRYESMDAERFRMMGGMLIHPSALDVDTEGDAWRVYGVILPDQPTEE